MGEHIVPPDFDHCVLSLLCRALDCL